jgi:hypothetical protein
VKKEIARRRLSGGYSLDKELGMTKFKDVSEISRNSESKDQGKSKAWRKNPKIRKERSRGCLRVGPR